MSEGTLRIKNIPLNRDKMMPLFISEHINESKFKNDEPKKKDCQSISMPLLPADKVLSPLEDEVESTFKNEVDSITENLNDIEFLNEKFDDLREKEINNTLTELEKILLSTVEERILEFPNPYLPSDYKDGINTIKRIDALEKRFGKKHSQKSNKRRTIFRIIFSWLG